MQTFIMVQNTMLYIFSYFCDVLQYACTVLLTYKNNPIQHLLGHD